MTIDMSPALMSQLREKLGERGFSLDLLNMNTLWEDCRQLSSIAKLRISDEQQECYVFVKRYQRQDFIFWEGDPWVEASQLVRARSTTYAKLVPELIAFEESSNTLVLSAIEGIEFSTLLNRYSKRPLNLMFSSRLQKHIIDCADFLYEFHTAQDYQVSMYDWRTNLEWVMKRIERLGALTIGVIDTQLLKNTARALVKSVDLLLTQRVQQGSLHGDYAPHNILVDRADKQALGVIDFANCRVGPIAFDIAKFLSYLDLLLGLPEHSQSAIKKLKQTFLIQYPEQDIEQGLEYQYCLTGYKLNQLLLLGQSERSRTRDKQVRKLNESLNEFVIQVNKL